MIKSLDVSSESCPGIKQYMTVLVNITPVSLFQWGIVQYVIFVYNMGMEMLLYCIICTFDFGILIQFLFFVSLFGFLRQDFSVVLDSLYRPSCPLTHRYPPPSASLSAGICFKTGSLCIPGCPETHRDHLSLPPQAEIHGMATIANTNECLFSVHALPGLLFPYGPAMRTKTFFFDKQSLTRGHGKLGPDMCVDCSQCRQREARAVVLGGRKQVVGPFPPQRTKP